MLGSVGSPWKYFGVLVSPWKSLEVLGSPPEQLHQVDVRVVFALVL